MPSGSRGGSRGSHGGSRGGGSRGGSRGGHGGSSGPTFIVRHHSRHSFKLRSRPGKPDRYFDIDSLHGVVMGLLAMLLLFFGFGACEQADTVEFLREDYAYYQNMIVEAELDPDTYIVDAMVTGRFYEDSYEKYYITYKIPLDNAGYTGDLYLAGYSFSVYDKEEIEEFTVGDWIDVAIDTPGVFTYTDSVPMDYKDMPIEKDGEYQNAVSTQRVLRTIFLSAIVLGVAWVIVFIVLSKKAEKEYVKAHPVNASVVKNADAANYCEYCGTYMVRDNNPKCPACGAAKKL